jgi:hypothetical protein
MNEKCIRYDLDDDMLSIEEILMEASAFNLRNEVYLKAHERFLQSNNITLLDAVREAYDVLITEKMKNL